MLQSMVKRGSATNKMPQGGFCTICLVLATCWKLPDLGCNKLQRQMCLEEEVEAFFRESHGLGSWSSGPGAVCFCRACCSPSEVPIKVNQLVCVAESALLSPLLPVRRYCRASVAS